MLPLGQAQMMSNEGGVASRIRKLVVVLSRASDGARTRDRKQPSCPRKRFTTNDSTFSAEYHAEIDYDNEHRFAEHEHDEEEHDEEEQSFLARIRG